MYWVASFILSTELRTLYSLPTNTSHPLFTASVRITLNVQRLLRSKQFKACKYKCLSNLMHEINQKGRNEREIEGKP